MNNVVLIGRLTKDPELRYIQGSGTAVSTFTLAVNRDFTKKDGTREADFIPIEVMGKAAEFCANYLTKGRLVACNGQLRIDNYQGQDGSWKSYTKVSCRQVNALDKREGVENGDFNTNGNNVYSNNDFEPAGLNPNDFGAVDDDNIPF